MHKSAFLDIVHAEAIEKTAYGDILETTCLKEYQSDSLPTRIMCKFFNVTCKKFV